VEHENQSESDLLEGNQRKRGRHGPPPECEYSDDPNAYANYEDYAANWWKRPQPPEPLETDEDDTSDRDDISGDNGAWLRREMQKAIDREDYERAAELRDEIRKMGD
jgi:hypothetical protein